ncbi:MAG: hypothetical protein HQ546_05120, partial [Planctomycetes bacterium]|nr:hypothetical protein [Planctomycetota bacterium]
KRADAVYRKELAAARYLTAVKAAGNADDIAAAEEKLKRLREAAKLQREAKETAEGEEAFARGLAARAAYIAMEKLGASAVAVDRTSRATEAKGTFNAMALLGLQAGGMKDPLVPLTERLIKVAEGMRSDIRGIGLDFA